MPRESKGAHLWLRPESNKGGRRRSAVWLIRDGSIERSTGCAPSDRAKAEEALAAYIAEKYRPDRTKSRSPSAIPVADVLNIYLEDKGVNHSRPENTKARVLSLNSFFGDKFLSDINGSLCRAYVRFRGSETAARRELEDLKAAINHHRKEGLCSEVIGIVLPDKSLPRERWLTRSEAARLLWAAWRARKANVHSGGDTHVPVGRHLARFILVGLYTGTRAGAICGASLDRVSGRGYIDLERGLFHRRPPRTRETNKRQPPVKLPPRLLAHLRRWGRLGLCQEAVVEWNGKPIQRVTKSFARAVKVAGLEDVSPHTLRHTAATWLMQNGADMWAAAGYLGMTMQTLEKNYGHHHPDYQKDAVEALSRR